jgi:hypothetical protein
MPQRILGGAALACVTIACGWILGSNLASTPDGKADKLVSVRLAHPMPATSAATQTYSQSAAASNSDFALFDARHFLGFPPGRFSMDATDEADGASGAPLSISPPQNVAAAPANAPRMALGVAPRRSPPMRRVALRAGGDDLSAVSNSRAAKPTFFERLFGKRSPSIFEKLFGPSPAKVTLAYAGPDDGGLGAGQGIAAGRYDTQTAVYDISAHTVYMPDGTTLEAHSGFGGLLDDPRYTDAKDRGATPTDVYDLEPRESLFHGVRALRLIPEDNSKVFGRSGLLAHSYMLGPNGQSNGCVSFRDYEAFLEAYKNHEITRLAVVSSAD